MNQQQLQTARAVLWHQNAQPLLTHDESATWLETAGLCLFLPRHGQLPAPAPSFVEACMGQASATPPADAISHAMELAAPLIEGGRVIPLNLLGTFSEQPDYLVSAETLRWAAAVRAGRNWKSAPGGRTAPIVVRAWEILERRGTSTAAEVREELGREATEAAALRALIELWSTFRVAPVYASGQPTRWSLLRMRHSKELAAASNTAQPTALSALVSLYLRSAVAASAEETEVFLSPLTARSRIREVVHGMMATRQLATTTLGAQTLVFVEGSLEELLPDAEPVEAETSGAGQAAATGAEVTRRRVPGRESGLRERERRPEQRRPEQGRPGQQRPGQRAPGPQRAGQRKEWQSGKGGEEKRGAFGFRREERSGEQARAAGPRKEFRGGERREETGGKRGTFQRAGRKPFGQKRPWQKDERPPRPFDGGKEGRGRPFREESGEQRSGQRPGGAFAKQQPPWKQGERRPGREEGQAREDRPQRRERAGQGWAGEREQRPQGGQRRDQPRASAGRGTSVRKPQAPSPGQREQRREGGWKPFRRKAEGQGAEREGTAQRRESLGRKERSPRREGPESGERREPARSGFGSRGQGFSKGRPKREGETGSFRPKFSGKKFAGKKFPGKGSSGSGFSAKKFSGAKFSGEKRAGSDRRADGAPGARRFPPGRPGAGKQGGRSLAERRGEGGKRFGTGKDNRGGKFGGSGRSERGRPPGKVFRKGRGRGADENPHKEENPQ